MALNPFTNGRLELQDQLSHPRHRAFQSLNSGKRVWKGKIWKAFDWRRKKKGKKKCDGIHPTHVETLDSKVNSHAQGIGESCGSDARITAQLHEGVAVREANPCRYLGQVDGRLMFLGVIDGVLVTRRLSHGVSRTLSVAHSWKLHTPDKIIWAEEVWFRVYKRKRNVQSLTIEGVAQRGHRWPKGEKVPEKRDGQPYV